ncbi:MAG: hypothetical protein DME98_15855 [Verrucomicrobia bacterium]|nr:MAG: hypothetical protein DME98_15855 [Verrucomicrobiota bacterium]PYJ35507.1 MAG: hypothetical protein DME88_01815 [Verrucomicrobiota bacterium]
MHENVRSVRNLCWSGSNGIKIDYDLPRSADFSATGRIRCGEQVCCIAGFQTRLALGSSTREKTEPCRFGNRRYPPALSPFSAESGNLKVCNAFRWISPIPDWSGCIINCAPVVRRTKLKIRFGLAFTCAATFRM